MQRWSALCGRECDAFSERECVRDQLESRRTCEAISQGRCVSVDTPLSLDIAGRDGETVSEVQKQRRWESFGEHICNLPCTGNVRDAHLADGDLVTNKVNVELDMLCSPVMYWIPQHVDRGDVVAERHCRGWNLAMELAKEVSELGALGDGVGDGAVLRLSARPRDRGLSLEHHETRE